MVTMADKVVQCFLGHFREQWERLAQEGKCDAVDGAEYQRVLKQWWRLCGPCATEQFILTSVNIQSASPRALAESIIKDGAAQAK